MLKQADIDEISEIDRTPFVDFLLDGPTFILGCVRGTLVAPPFSREYDGGRVFGAGGYGFTRAQFRHYAEAVRACLAAKDIIVSYGTSFPTSDWLNKTTPETFVVWLYKNAAQEMGS